MRISCSQIVLPVMSDHPCDKLPYQHRAPSKVSMYVLCSRRESRHSFQWRFIIGTVFWCSKVRASIHYKSFVNVTKAIKKRPSRSRRGKGHFPAKARASRRQNVNTAATSKWKLHGLMTMLPLSLISQTWPCSGWKMNGIKAASTRS